jgi:HupE / UreJ protein
MSGKVAFCRLALLLAALTILAAPALAHFIPRDVTVLSFVKPEGNTLKVLMRVPVKGIEDVEVPRRAQEYVDLTRIEPALRDTARVFLLDNLSIYEGDTLLANSNIVAVQFSLESDRSFENYDTALAHITGPPLPADTSIFWEQGILDVLVEYPIQSDRSYFSIDAQFERLALTVITAVRFMPPGGIERVYELEGNAGLVRLDPRWHQAVGRFVVMGFEHILEGIDHLLFLLLLIVPFRRLRTLIPIVTAFTVAHSITLIASAYKLSPQALWFPPLIETLIAMSIVYMALENVVKPNAAARWVITFAFGLVHGFGFSFVLEHTLQFAGSHLLTSLLAFNVGVELGQLLVLVIVVPLLNYMFKHVIAERMGTIILSVIVGHTAWDWMIERFGVLQMFPWPDVTTADLASALRWLFVLVALTAGVWLVYVLTQRPGDRKAGEPAE